MKNILFLVFLLPFLALAQERQQKQAIRSGGGFGSSNSTMYQSPSFRQQSARESFSESAQKQSIRDN